MNGNHRKVKKKKNPLPVMSVLGFTDGNGVSDVSLL